jgi:hypothetical protein
LLIYSNRKFDSLVKHMPDLKALDQALIVSTKLQEKGVGEKEQPSETVAELQLQSQKAQEKQVPMVNQLEVLVDSKKLPEKGDEVKGQPKEMTALRNASAKYICRMCNVGCHSPIVFETHLRGQKHAANLNQSKDQALIDSKKLQEKGFGEKEQPRETIVEPQLQSQNAQENSKCFEKHVVMVNQSEVSFLILVIWYFNLQFPV